MLKTVVLLNNFVETVIGSGFFVGGGGVYRKFFFIGKSNFCKITNVIFDQFNASLLNKSIHVFKIIRIRSNNIQKYDFTSILALFKVL